MRKKILSVLVLMAVPVFMLYAGPGEEGCTTAIISGAASLDGRPMLWKNRDTDFLSNKVIYVLEKPYSYLGLVNAEETSGRMVYAGLNELGFGIMNSVAYNLPKNKSGEMKDLEGIIMADALRTCRTVDDFERYIQENLGPGLGSWANFGVIDGQGSAVIFEVHNRGWQKYNALDTPEKYLVNSNFARSGKENAGAGYLRFERASQLFEEIPGGKVSHEYILQHISRDLGHTLLDQPTLKDLKSISVKRPVWILSRDTINRTSTSVAVVICGKKPADKDAAATFWVILSEPVTAIALPLWVEAKESPLPLHEGETAPLCQESLRIKKILRPLSGGNRDQYLDLTRLDNREGQGFLPLILETEKVILAETAEFLKTSHTREEYAAFQDRMAHKALQTLKRIR